MNHISPPNPEEFQSLRRNLERFRFLVESSRDLFFEVVADGKFLCASPNVQSVLGYEHDELLHIGVSNIVHPDDLTALRTQLESQQACVTCRYRHKDGSWRWMETSCRDFPAHDGLKCSLLIARDVTEQNEVKRGKAALEGQLRQAQKLDALGTLAGGIAHDFNNILAIIMAYTELANMDADNPEEARKHLVEVRKASERAKDLVQQILTFSRQQKQERKPVRLQLVLKEALKLLRSTLPATIEMHSQIDLATPIVLADPTQIHQVMMNLCTNAAHAMRDRPGRLAVFLRPCDVDEALARTLEDLHPGRYAWLTVSDTGHGMDTEVLKRIFEPFFTTKGPGEGTGLGLPVVHGIVREHEGAISVQSRLGEGTTFDLYFPIHQTTVTEVPEIPAALPRGRGEHILFVDDEPAICDSARTILERLGYHVTTQTNPTEALSRFRNHPEQFDLVIADLTMPLMTGTDLAREIAHVRPKIPLLLVTGFSGSWTPEKVRELGVHDLIAKPITPSALATAIHHVLNKAAEDQQTHD